MTQHLVEVTGGVDTHRGTHTAAAVGTAGRVLGCAQLEATPAGYAALLGAVLVRHCGAGGRRGQRRHGAGLARHLHAAGVRLVEIELIAEAELALPTQ